MNSQKDKESSGHIKAAVIGGVFTLLAAIIAGIFLIFNTMVNKGTVDLGLAKPSEQPTVVTSQNPQSTTNTPTVSSTKPSLNAVSSISDDFNNPPFDGSYNKELWRYFSGYSQNIFQQNGVLAIMNTSNDLGLVSNQFDSFVLTSPFSYEAKLMMSSSAHDGKLHLKIDADVNGGFWGSECVLAASKTDSMASTYCWAGTENNTEYIQASNDVEFDTWHTFRIEISPVMKINYYLDGNLLGVYTPVNGDELQNYKYYAVLGVHSVTSSFSGYFDDVKIEIK